MAQSWMFSVINVTYAVCCIASIFVSSLGVHEPLCIYRNFDDIVCRWKKAESTTTENDGYGEITAVQFSRKDSQAFEECVEFNDTSASNYSSCVWDYPAAWVNETLSIKVVSSPQSANSSIVFDYDPREHVMLSPPVLNFTRRKIGNSVNVTMKISYPNRDMEEKILTNCGPPEVKVIYNPVPTKRIRVYTEQGSWGDWRQAWDRSPWEAHPSLGNESKVKNFTHYGNQTHLDMIPITKRHETYLTQVRWRVNSNLCQGSWGPYRTYRISTANIAVTPINVVVQPGENVTLACESTVRLSNFLWRVSNGSGKKIFKRTLRPENGFVSHLRLDNVTTGRYFVECWSDETNGSDGVMVDVGVAPSPAVVECLMENKEKLHCRYNICSPQIKEQQYLYKNSLVVSFRSKSRDRYERKAHPIANCFLSDEIDFMRYHPYMDVEVKTSNTFGSAVSELSFARDQNVHPSSPKLSVSSIDWDQSGAVVSITAQFPATDSSNVLHRYCERVVLSIGYKVIPNDTDLSQIKFVTDFDFWINWENGEDKLNQEDVVLMKNVTYVERTMPMPNEVSEDGETHEPVKLQLFPLAANTRYLMAVKWKFESNFCRGDWSVPSHESQRIGNLKPPRFRDVSLIFLSNRNQFPGNFRNRNWTRDALLVVWNNIDEENPGIQKRNNVEYRLFDTNGSVVRSTPCRDECNAIPLTDNYGHTSLFQVNASNNRGTETSSIFRRTEMSVERCAATVISISLASVSDSHLNFKIDWIYAKTSPPNDCVLSQLEKTRLHVHLLAWKEINPTSTDYGKIWKTKFLREEPPLNATVYTFHVTVVRSEYEPSKNEFGTRVSTISEHVNFTYPFQTDTAYGIGVALSEEVRKIGVFNQSPATLDANLYYFVKNPKQSKGAPEKLTTSDIGMNEITINWLPSKPQERSGPVVRYEIFANRDKRCSFRHNQSACNLHEAPSKDCYGKPDKVYEVANVSRPYDWKMEERKYNEFMSVTIENLIPGTIYYIIVWEVTETGRNKCFRHVAERTHILGHIWIVFVTVCALFIIAAISLLLTFRRKVKNLFGIDVPEPRIWITWKDTDTNETTTKLSSDDDFQDNDARNYYVALSKSLEITNCSNVDSNSDVLDDDTPLMITLTKQESMQRIDLEQNCLQNNNDLQKLCRSDCHLEIERPAICATSVDSLGKTLTESSSFGSDEQCCSTSTAGNAADLWPRGNLTSEGEDDAEDAYVSASEAASMSWPLGDENSGECLLKQSA